MADRNKRGRGSLNLAGTKALIAIGALASTLLGWTELTQMGAPAVQPTAQPTDVQLDLQPLPTLIPPSDLVSAAAAPAPAAAPTQAAPQLRKVNVPVASGGGGGGGGGHAAASTHSSH